MKRLVGQGDRLFYDDLVRIAIPIALQNLIVSSVNMLDTVMVGRLGAAQLAAVMLGKKIGEGKRDTAYDWANRFALMAPLIGLITAVLLLPATKALPWLFALGPEPLRQARLMIFVLGHFLIYLEYGY